MEGDAYNNLTFATDYAQAYRADGTAIRFTRTERLLLACLCSHAGMLRSREQLLDAVGEIGSDASDRNVDFYITRLRRKIGDSARSPRYIATRYGEGYVWIAPPRPPAEAPVDFFVVVGPILMIGASDGSEAAFAEALADALRRRLPPERRVAVRADAPVPESPFRISLTFMAAGDGSECVSSLHAREATRVIAVRRDACGDVDMDALAERHLVALWQFHVDEAGQVAPDAPPLAVRMVEAGALFAGNAPADQPPEVAHLKGEAFPPSAIWRRNDVRLRQIIREGKGTASTRLMLAINIYTRYVIDGWRFLANSDPREQDQAELESLILDNLPELLDDPQNALSAAHVLSFMGPAHQVLALDIAEEAFTRSTALADAYSVLGRLRGFAGDFDGALDLLHRAKPFCKPGSMFERYVASCICQVLMAAGDFDAKDRVLETLTRNPVSKGPYRLVYARPGETAPSLPVRIHLALMPRKYARALVLWSYYISARVFRSEAAKENLIVGLAGHLRRRFGDDIIPDEVSAAIPATLGDDPARRPAAVCV